MQRDTTKKYYVLHSWVGAVTAILLFIIAFTGAVSVFGRGELKVWANPDIRAQLGHDYAAIEQLIKSHATEIDPAYLDHVQVIFPGPHGAETLAIIFEREIELDDGSHQHYAIWFDHQPQTLVLQNRREGELLELFESRPSDMADFIVGFHADLHLGSPLGLILTGFLGLTLFASVITGIFIHPKILKELFVFRPWRSLRLLFTDTHKVLGVWGLLFHGTIAFTGAFLGLATVLLIPAAAFVSFGGDQDKLVETFLPEIEPVLTHQQADMRFASTLDTMSQQNPEMILGSATFYGWGDSAAIIAVNTLGGKKLASETFEFSAVTGEPIRQYTTFGQLNGVSILILDAMAPLHFGNFGGVWVKFIWFSLGLSTALVAASGMMIWIERRAFGAEGRMSLNTYQRISRFTAGSCVGVVVATAALFLAQLLLIANWVPNNAQHNSGFYLGTVFFVVWILGIAWAMLRRNAYIGTRDLLLCAGFLALAALPINGVITGDWIVNSLFSERKITAGVDISLLVFGSLLVWSGIKLPAHRPARQKATQADFANDIMAGNLAAIPMNGGPMNDSPMNNIPLDNDSITNSDTKHTTGIAIKTDALTGEFS